MHELARGEVVVGTVVQPEQLRVALDFRQRRGVDALRVGDDLLDHMAHLERVAMFLVDEDVAAGQRGLVEVIDQRLLLERQGRKAVRIQLHDGRIVDALEQILAFWRAGAAGAAGASGAAGDEQPMRPQSSRAGAKRRMTI